jgi:hypothetical protein
MTDKGCFGVIFRTRYTLVEEEENLVKTYAASAGDPRGIFLGPDQRHSNSHTPMRVFVEQSNFLNRMIDYIDYT